MPVSCAWSRLPSVPAHRCRAWRIDTPWCFWRRPSRSQERPGPGPEIPFAPWRCSWWRHRVHLSWPYRSQSCPACRELPQQGILIKGGQALETLARVRSLVIDKTGTLTHGRARVVSIDVASGQSADELLRIAASLDQASKHMIAQAIVEEAQKKGLKLAVPGDVVETAGEGLEGRVEGHHVVVGGYRFVSERVLGVGLALWRADRPAGAAAVAVGIDGKFAGVLILADELRAGTRALLQSLRALGVERIVLATGDRHDVAETGREGPVDRCAEIGTHPRPENLGGLVRTQARPGHDDRRRRQ